MGEFNLIFSPFYWKVKVDETQDILDKCLEKIQDNVNRNPVLIPSKWECTLHSSYDGNDPAISLDAEFLTPIYTKYVKIFLNEFKLKEGRYTLQHPWYNAFSKSHFQEPHTHLPRYFSAVHYAIFNEKEHLATTFINPNQSACQAVREVQKNIIPKLTPSLLEHSLYMEYFTPQNITQGDLIIFPAFLNHYVKPNLSEKRRITITFNVDIVE